MCQKFRQHWRQVSAQTKVISHEMSFGIILLGREIILKWNVCWEEEEDGLESEENWKCMRVFVCKWDGRCWLVLVKTVGYQISQTFWFGSGMCAFIFEVIVKKFLWNVCADIGPGNECGASSWKYIHRTHRHTLTHVLHTNLLHTYTLHAKCLTEWVWNSFIGTDGLKMWENGKN